ncbi:PilW family protein [uncultured Oceanicoccus sp.]|uniref:PilW family protein n=1 Tax=uncultured Oceanicoccus sp. TaxID=1706381 RepID=UPI0030DB4B18
MIDYQRGFSLIELMIAMTLGLLLTAGAMQFMASTRQTFELNNDISRIQENGRIAMDILVKDLRMAGYRQTLNGDDTAPHYFDFQTNCSRDHPTCTLNQYIDSTDSITHGSDRLSIQYDPPADDLGGEARDCLGKKLDATERHSIIVNVYTIDTVNGINSLYCRGYNKNKGTWLERGAQPLIDGIDNMQVLYGVTDTSDSTGSVNQYMPQSALEESDWPYIKSVSIALLVSNGLQRGFAKAQARKYRLLDSAELETADTDRQARRIYSTTVQLKNSR